MPVITVISQGLKIAQKLYKISMKYKMLDVNQKFIRKYVPPGYRRQAEFAVETLIGGGLLYQAVDFAYYALQTAKRPTPGKSGKTRNYMEQTRGRLGYARYSTSYRDKRRYCRRRSPYR